MKVRYKKVKGDLLYNIKQSYDAHEARIKISNRRNSDEKIRVINLAISSFAMWLIMDSGCNLSAIYNLKMEDTDSITYDIPNHKLVVSKPRAGFKKIEFPLTNKMVQGLKGFLNFRKYVLNLFNEEVTSKISNNLFFSFTLDKSDTTKPLILPYSAKDLATFRNWYNSIFGKENWINPRAARASNSNLIKNLNDDVSIVDAVQISTERLGHSKKVDIIDYSECTKEQHHTQLTNFFDTVYEKMIFKNRNTEKTIPVVLNADCSPSISGHCINNAPMRASGFNEYIETPSCSNPSTCLFCENYVVHTDEIDLRKLFSLRKITELNSDLKDEIIIIKYRIDEILKFIVNQNELLIPLISKIKKEVDDGYLDEHWENILDLLIDLGVQMYEE